MKPFRLRVLEALTEVLEGITIANGYQNDMAGKVFRGRTAFGAESPEQMLSILEDPRNFDPVEQPPTSTASRGEWKLLIQGFLQDDPVHPTDQAYHLCADVKKALTLARKNGENSSTGTFGLGRKSPCIDSGSAIGVQIGAGVIRPGDDVSATAYFWLPLTLMLLEDHENPFA